MSKCCFCGMEGEFIKAHLIPVSVLKKDFFSSGKYSYICGSNDKYLRKSPSGVYDDSILCGECDRYLGELDQLGSEFLNSFSVADDVEYFVDGLVAKIKGVDAKKLALFLMSVIWRFSISNRTESSDVNLCDYEEKVKQCLRAKINLFPKEIDVFAIMWRDHIEGGGAAILMPHKSDLHGCKGYYLYFPRFAFFVKFDAGDWGDMKGVSFNGNEGDGFIARVYDFEDSGLPENIIKSIASKKNIKS